MMSAQGDAVLLRSVAEVARAAAATDGLTISWLDGTALVVRGARNIAFADGRLTVSGSTPVAWTTDSMAQQIVEAYDAALSAVPDPVTLFVWTKTLWANVLTVRHMYDDLGQTPIYQARHGWQTDAQFVGDLYAKAWERPPTGTEMAWCLDALARGAVTREWLLYAVGLAQDSQRVVPGAGRHDPYGVYDEVQAPGTLLHARESLASTAMDASGKAVTVRAAAELSRLEVAPHGAVLRWEDGEVVRLASPHTILFADGRLSLDAGSRDAVLARIFAAITGDEMPGWAGAVLGRTLDGGQSMLTMTQGLLGSPQAAAHLGGLDPAGKVAALHESLMGKSADAATVASLVGALQAGVSVADLIIWLAGLPQAAAAYAASHPTGTWVPDTDAAPVMRAYDAVMDDVPDPMSLLIWKPVVNGSFIGLRGIYENLMDTPAYHALHDGMGDRAWVADMYRDAYEREATPAELNAWVGALQAGVSRVDVAVVIGEQQPLPDPVRTAIADSQLL